MKNLSSPMTTIIAPTELSGTYPNSAVQNILECIRRGNCCRVIGPRHRGKSRVMRQAATQLSQLGFYHTIYITLEQISMSSNRQFFSSIFHELLKIFPNHRRDHATSYSVATPGEFQIALIEFVNSLDSDLVVFIDDLELAPPNLIAILLSTIRAVFITLINQSGRHFQVVICGSVDFHQLALKGVSRFESVSDLVLVGDLNLNERQSYLTRILTESGITALHEGESSFLNQTGGDLILIKSLVTVCIDLLRQRGETTLDEGVIPEAIQMLLNRPPNLEINEVYSLIEADPDLLSCLLMILQQGEVSANHLPLRSFDNPNPLDLSGVFIKQDEYYSLKCPLWASILEKQFSDEHIARLYTMAGYWQRAISYYGQTINLRGIDKKSDLFIATINAIYTSEDDNQAVSYLAQGLQACYPQCDIVIYLRTESTLCPAYYTPIIIGSNQPSVQEIRLSNVRAPEVEAMTGPDYTVSFRNRKARFLFPLRVHSSASAIGLVSFSERFSDPDLFQRQEDIMQMIRFLHQAARAINGIQNYSQLLSDAENRVQTLQNLDFILTSVLNNPQLSDEIAYRLLLAGVTANEGLRFNRAALFLFDEFSQCLVGTLGVGHLTWESADFEWRNLTYQTLQELVTDLLHTKQPYTPLHRQIAGLQLPIEQAGAIGDTFRSGEARFSSHAAPIEDLPEILAKAFDPPEAYALVPIIAGDRKLGVVYVDDKFTNRPINESRSASLVSFLNHAALVMENVRSLEAEIQRADILTRLLEVERAVNDRITQSLKTTLQEIAHSAWILIGADSTVVYSLLPNNSENANYFKADLMANEHTRHNPIGLPNSNKGIVKWIISDRNGLVHIPDVRSLLPFPDGYHPRESRFLRQEGVRSLVGVRLGSSEQPAGLLIINWREPHQLSADDLTILNVFASFAGIAITSARRHEQVHQDLLKRTQELETLGELLEASLESRSEPEIDKLIQEMLKSVEQLTSASSIRLFRLEPHDRICIFRLTRDGNLARRFIKTHENQAVLKALETRKSVQEMRNTILKKDSSTDWYSSIAKNRVAIPLHKGDNCLGVLYIEIAETDHFPTNDKHLEILELMVDRLAMTFYQAEVYKVLRGLLDIAIKLHPKSKLDQVIKDLINGAMEAIPSVSTITVFYWKLETREFKLGDSAGLKYKRYVKDVSLAPESIVDRLLKRGGPIFADYTEDDPDLYSPFAQREGIRSTAGMPLTIGKENAGYIFFNFRRRHHFDDNEKGLLQLFAQLAAIAIHRASLQAESERRQDRMEAVAEITPLIARANPNLNEVYRTVLREIQKAIPNVNNACIIEKQPSVRDSSSRKYHLSIKPLSWEFYHPERSLSQDGFDVDVRRKQSIVNRVIESGVSEHFGDVRKDPDEIRLILSTRSKLCVPIPTQTGVNEAILLESDLPNGFSQKDQSLVEVLANHLAIALNNEKHFRDQGERQTRERIAWLSTVVIHDINKIIANIPDVVSELREELDGDQDPYRIDDYLDDLQRAAENTHRISSQLQDFILAGNFEPAPTMIEHILEQVVAKFDEIRPDNIHIQYQSDSILPELEIDRFWIELMLENLIQNAIEAIPTKHFGLVQVRAWVEKETVSIAVEDNGRGIPETSLHNDIFLPGYTTKSDKTMPHGIGLYNSKQIANAHGGDIKVVSMVDTGSTFTVTLPINKPE